jgi:chemosensory pili system protein ChpA (sensor histidine kinase/response regulator)
MSGGDATGFDEMDDELLEIFLEEALEIADSLEQNMQPWRSAPTDRTLLGDINRSLHTLKGGARLSELSVLGDLTHVLESLLIGVADRRITVSDDMIDLVHQSVDEIVSMLEQVGDRQYPKENKALLDAINLVLNQDEAEPHDDFAEDSDSPDHTGNNFTEENESSDQASNNFAELDDELLEIFLDEASEIADSLEQIMQPWRSAPTDRGILGDINRSLHTLKGGARLSELPVLGDLTHVLESLLIGVADRRITVSDSMIDLVQQSVDEILSMLEQVRERQYPKENKALLDAINQTLNQDAAEPHDDFAEDNDSPDQADNNFTEENESSSQADNNFAELDDELLEIFLDEASEIADSLEQIMQPWRSAPTDRGILGDINRSLHTLKGGARLSELPVLGDLTHVLESLLIGVADRRITVSDSMIDLVQQSVDEILSMLEQVRERQYPKENKALLDAINQALNQDAAEPHDDFAEKSFENSHEQVAETKRESRSDDVDDELDSLAKINKESSIGYSGNKEVIRSVLLPMNNGRLLLPNAAVAEIIPYSTPEYQDSSPEWCLGSMDWRGQRIPLISYESLSGGSVPAVSRRTRIAVCNAISGMSGVQFFGLVCSQIPRLIRVNSDNVRIADEQSDLPTVLQDVMLGEVRATIPRIETIEDILRDNIA